MVVQQPVLYLSCAQLSSHVTPKVPPNGCYVLQVQASMQRILRDCNFLQKISCGYDVLV